MFTLYGVLTCIYSYRGVLTNIAVETQSYVFRTYSNVRNGVYRVECSIGGTPVQMAECQLVQGVNLIFIQIVTQLAEFVFSIAQMRNVFGCTALVLGSVHCVARVLSPTRLLSWMRPVVKLQRLYYNLWLEQYELMWGGVRVLRNSHLYNTRFETNTVCIDDAAKDASTFTKVPRFPKSCPAKLKNGLRNGS